MEVREFKAHDTPVVGRMFGGYAMRVRGFGPVLCIAPTGAFSPCAATRRAKARPIRSAQQNEKAKKVTRKQGHTLPKNSSDRLETNESRLRPDDQGVIVLIVSGVVKDASRSVGTSAAKIYCANQASLPDTNRRRALTREVHGVLPLERKLSLFHRASLVGSVGGAVLCVSP